MDFRVLGPFDVVVGGRSLPLGGPKQRIVLASLALRPNELVSTETIIDAVWGDTPPASGVAVVRTYVSRLRQVLAATNGAEVDLVNRPPGYVLRLDPERVDAHRFERLVDQARGELDAGGHAAAAATLRRALTLWRGEVLADLSIGPRLQAAAARLGEMRMAAVEDRIDAELELGRHAALIGDLEELTAQHPFRERLWAQRIVALYRSGRQADALAAYRSVRASLAEQLGIDPGPQLRALEAAVLRQSDDLAGASLPRGPHHCGGRGDHAGPSGALAPTGAPGHEGPAASPAPATDPGAAIARQVEAGRQALAVRAHEEAFRRFRAASMLIEGTGNVEPDVAYAVWYGMTAAAAVTGRWPDHQRRGYLSAASIAREQGWPEHLAVAAIGWALYSSAADCPRPETGDLQGGRTTDRLLDEALARLGTASPVVRCVLLAFKVLHAVMLDRGDEARALLGSVDALAASRGDPTMDVCARLARCWVLLDSPDARELRRCATHALEIPLPPGIGTLLHACLLPVLALSMLRLGDRAGFEATRARLAAHPDIPRSTHLQASLHMWDAAICLASGRLADAARLAATLPGTADWSIWDKVSVLQTTVAAGLRGDLPVIRSRLGQAVASTPPVPLLRAALAHLDARRGHVAEARRQIHALRPTVQEGALGLGRSIMLTCLAETCAIVRAADLAGDLLRLLGEHSGQMLVSYTGATIDGAADQSIGQVLMALGRHDEAVDHLVAAEELERSFGAEALALRSVYWQARARLERGRRADGDVARALLHEAESSARSLGLATVEQDCRAALDEVT